MNAGRTLELEYEFEAPLDTVYRAFTQPDLLGRWWGPEGTRVYRCHVDFRVGGDWRIGIVTSSGEKRDVAGKYTSIAPDKIAFTWQWHYEGAPPEETLVTIEFATIEPERTRIRLQQVEFASRETCDAHRDGWTSTLGELTRFLRTEEVNR